MILEIVPNPAFIGVPKFNVLPRPLKLEDALLKPFLEVNIGRLRIMLTNGPQNFEPNSRFEFEN